MGTAGVSCASLEELARTRGFQIAAVVTRPEQPKGRELKPQSPPVKTLALRLSLPVLQPQRARDGKFIAELGELKPDLIVVVGYGQILPSSILELPCHGCLNVHMSLLPRYRGAAPIQWAIANGDTETGVTIMKMDVGLDTGDIVAQRRTPIQATDNFATLHDRLAQLGAELLVEYIPGYIAGEIRPTPQPAEGISHAPKIKKEDGRIDWSLTAKTIWSRLRAFTPWPGAFTSLPAQPKPKMLKIWKAEVVERSAIPGEILSADKSGIVVACGVDALRILELQREGGRRMSATEFLAGHALKVGGKFG